VQKHIRDQRLSTKRTQVVKYLINIFKMLNTVSDHGSPYNPSYRGGSPLGITTLPTERQLIATKKSWAWWPVILAMREI
jgi:hypothetical protein